LYHFEISSGVKLAERSNSCTENVKLWMADSDDMAPQQFFTTPFAKIDAILKHDCS
jgi:hypothetical protein